MVHRFDQVIECSTNLLQTHFFNASNSKISHISSTFEEENILLRVINKLNYMVNDILKM